MGERKIRDITKGYPPHDAILNYMRDRLLFEKRRDELRLRGQDLAEDNSYRNLKKRKTDVLDIMFKSMADIVFFFKSIAEHQELQNIFEDDIMDLLGIKRNDSQHDEPGFIFYDLLDYIIIGKGGRYSEKKDEHVDYRLILNHIAQKIVCYKITQSAVSILEMGKPRSVILGHFDNAWAWTEMLSNIALHDLDDEVPPRRILNLEKNVPHD